MVSRETSSGHPFDFAIHGLLKGFPARLRAGHMSGRRRRYEKDKQEAEAGKAGARQGRQVLVVVRRCCCCQTGAPSFRPCIASRPGRFLARKVQGSIQSIARVASMPSLDKVAAEIVAETCLRAPVVDKRVLRLRGGRVGQDVVESAASGEGGGSEGWAHRTCRMIYGLCQGRTQVLLSSTRVARALTALLSCHREHGSGWHAYS